MIRVLIVDDYQEHADTLVSTLNMYGAQAQSASTYKEAFQKIEGGFSPNLIIYDGLMEGMHAWKFAHRLLSGTGMLIQRPYLVCLTGYATTLHRRLCEECGYDEYVTKPIELSTLLGWIQKAREYLERQENSFS